MWRRRGGVVDTDALIARVRRLGVEPSDVEVKAAAGGLPSSVPETISAFANGSGGTLVLGLAEAAGFAPAPGFDASRIRDALADACATKVDPPCRAPIVVEEVEGARVVRLDVPELDPVEKPCFVTTRGTYGGSFIRGGDGDRQLTHYEVTQLLWNRRQPTFDREAVPGASRADLDGTLVNAYLERVRRNAPTLTGDEDDLLVTLNVLTRDGDGVLRPTLAGLLCFGTYPQQFFPQLFVSFVVLPRLRMGETGPDGRRFLDNKSLVGPIPTIVSDAITMAIKNMRAGAIITGAGREDRYDYPLEVTRELVVNAIMHRDYSPDATGTQVQIELYPDRLVIKNPGGLYGPITVADLASADQASTTRNRALATMLGDVEDLVERSRTLCENRGSGLLAVMAELRRVGMSPPEFDVSPGRMIVRLPQHALLGPETIGWIGTLRQQGLTNEQHLALAMMRSSGRVTNAMLQAWGVDPLTAGSALRDLVGRGLAVRSGGRRYASYHLLDSPGSHAGTPAPSAGGMSDSVRDELNTILAAIRGGTDTTRGLYEHLGLPPRTVARRLSALVDLGVIEPTRPRQSKKQSYRVTGRGEIR